MAADTDLGPDSRGEGIRLANAAIQAAKASVTAGVAGAAREASPTDGVKVVGMQ